MAYEYGSIDLGIRNPFRLEGGIRAVGGLLIDGFWPALIVSGTGVPLYSTIASRQAAKRFLESQEMKKIETVIATA